MTILHKIYRYESYKHYDFDLFTILDISLNFSVAVTRSTSEILLQKVLPS